MTQRSQLEDPRSARPSTANSAARAGPHRPASARSLRASPYMGNPVSHKSAVSSGTARTPGSARRQLRLTPHATPALATATTKRTRSTVKPRSSRRRAGSPAPRMADAMAAKQEWAAICEAELPAELEHQFASVLRVLRQHPLACMRRTVQAVRGEAGKAAREQEASFVTYDTEDSSSVCSADSSLAAASDRETVASYTEPPAPVFAMAAVPRSLRRVLFSASSGGDTSPAKQTAAAVAASHEDLEPALADTQREGPATPRAESPASLPSTPDRMFQHDPELAAAARSMAARLAAFEAGQATSSMLEAEDAAGPAGGSPARSELSQPSDDAADSFALSMSTASVGDQHSMLQTASIPGTTLEPVAPVSPTTPNCDGQGPVHHEPLWTNVGAESAGVEPACSPVPQGSVWLPAEDAEPEPSTAAPPVASPHPQRVRVTQSCATPDLTAYDPRTLSAARGGAAQVAQMAVHWQSPAATATSHPRLNNAAQARFAELRARMRALKASM